jgi:hypothetical protein
MTSSTLSRRALAAILAAGCLAAPTAMAQSAGNGPSVKEPARANVYVPPSPAASPEASETANVYVPPSPAASPDASETANVYVPPSPATSPNASETANVYVPPAQGGLRAPGSLAHPQGIAHAAVPSADDGASPWAVIGQALGCAALLGGAGLALVHRARRARRAVA